MIGRLINDRNSVQRSHEIVRALCQRSGPGIPFNPYRTVQRRSIIRIDDEASKAIARHRMNVERARCAGPSA